ncbi:MAG: hypothetical protein ACRCT1_09225 [Microcoleaceae cyanobacterium]
MKHKGTKTQRNIRIGGTIACEEFCRHLKGSITQKVKFVNTLI